MTKPIEIPYDSSVLIVLTGALGDVARGLIIPSIIKTQRPDLKITWLVERRWSPIVDLCTAVDNIVCFDKKNPFKSALEVYKKYKEFAPFYCSFDLQRHFKSGVLTRLSGAKIRVGFDRVGAKEGNWLFNNTFIKPINNSESKTLHYFSFLERVGIKIPSDPDFMIDVERCSAAAEPFNSELGNKKNIALVLGTSWPSKNWHYEGYRDLISELKEYQLILLGDGSQVELAASLMNNNVNNNLVNLVGKTNLVELAGVLAKCNLGVGPDTGSGHLAALFRVPYIGLFGPTDPNRVAPYRSESLAVVASVPCRPCFKRICPNPPELHQICMKQQSVSRIAELVIASIAAQ